MKRLAFTLLSAIATTTLAHSDPAPKAAGGPLLAHYLAIQRSLAADTAQSVEPEARQLAATARKLAAAGGDKELLGSIADAADHLQGTDLTALRAGLKPLSRAVALYRERSGAAGADLYYCPMEKAYWLQAAGPTQNPYFGSSMLGCGEKATAVTH
ncbi:MAG: hypothetical protein M3O15_12390 [Acidobacteriota bacterium]|nr:hypothetical protein [Acidobacteriota bacterium]